MVRFHAFFIYKSSVWSQHSHLVKLKKILLMKKLFFAYLLILPLLFSTGCQQNSARSIIGHTYAYVESNTQMLSLYFSSNGSVSVQYVNGSDVINSSNFTYKIKDYNVEIYFDKSDYWISSAQGTIFVNLMYSPEDDTLHYLGDVLYRVN